MRNIRVSEREISQCIIDLETNVVVNSDWELSHILLSIPESANADVVTAIEQSADDIYSRLQDNADFRELAVRYSDGRTALEGGTLGWMSGQQIPSIFTEVLQDMKAGHFSEPFRTSNSIHIVRVDDLLLSDDPGSANLGGDLGWSETNSFAPEFRAAAESAEIGVSTEPFRTQFGRHVLEVVERRVYDNTDEIKEQNCIVRIRNSKQEEETLLWMQRMRDEAFVVSRI